MSFGGFILGLLIMTVSFLLVRYTNRIEMNVGDLSDLLGFYGSRWLSWKLLGMLGLILGFLITFGLLQEFFSLTLGRLLQFGV